MMRFASPWPVTTACARYRSSAAAAMVTVQYIKAAKIDILTMTASARGHSEPVGWVERLRNPSAGFACVVTRWVSLRSTHPTGYPVAPQKISSPCPAFVASPNSRLERLNGNKHDACTLG